jgi:hypothetical protein
MYVARPASEQERASWPKTVKVPLETPFTDNRGSIQPLVDMMMESCVLINSRKGTVRLNHFHKTDWHHCYVLSGESEYYHRLTASSNPSTTSSTTAASPGTRSSASPGKSCPSPAAIGQSQVTHSEDWMPGGLDNTGCNDTAVSCQHTRL